MPCVASEDFLWWVEGKSLLLDQGVRASMPAFEPWDFQFLGSLKHRVEHALRIGCLGSSWVALDGEVPFLIFQPAFCAA